MHRVGTVQRFDPDRGFGFLHCPESPADVFFHVRDFDRRQGPPAVGMAVAFEEIHVGGKGPRAMVVRPITLAATTPPARKPRGAAAAAARGARSIPAGPSASLGLFLAALALELALLATGLVKGAFPAVLLAVLLVLNPALFWLYWHDKDAALRGGWRVPEHTLHLLSLAGAWPAAWWAQQLLRHKSRKPAFRRAYWVTVIGHLVVLAAWIAVPALP